mgnify:FL=1
MQDFDEEQLKEIHMGRLIQVLSHQMKRKSCVNSMINDDGLTTMQKHVLKFLLLETLHKVVYQKDIEEEFQIRKSTATGMLQLLEKNGFIVRESEKKDARSETHHSYKESGSTPSEHPCTHKAVGNTAYDRYFRS